MLLGGEGLLQLWSDSVGTQGKVEAPDHVKPAKPDDKPSATERLGGRAGETSHRDHIKRQRGENGIIVFRHAWAQTAAAYF